MRITYGRAMIYRLQRVLVSQFLDELVQFRYREVSFYVHARRHPIKTSTLGLFVRDDLGYCIIEHRRKPVCLESFINPVHKITTSSWIFLG